MNIERLSQGVRDAAAELGRTEACYLVNTFYQVQEYRKATANQIRSAERPSPVIDWLFEHLQGLETRIGQLLQRYADGNSVSLWSQSICGIGPIISAGLLAHIDIAKAATVGAVWRFAGQDPTSVWGKGEKRPWNADLKTLCWKIGESFVRVSGNEADFYGKFYQERKAYEQQKNEAGEYAEQAEAVLARSPTHAQRARYKEGKLPDGHIHARAKRYAVKLFLAHWHHVAYMEHYAEAPPKPYVIEHGGHAHMICPPNYPMGESRMDDDASEEKETDEDGEQREDRGNPHGR